MSRMSIGYLVLVRIDSTVEDELRLAYELGFQKIQLGVNDTPLMRDPAYIEKVKELIAKYGFEVTTVRAKWRKPAFWNLIDGPSTIGIVPPELRAVRVEDILNAAAFARDLGVKTIGTHLGFLPLDPRDRKYVGTVNATRALMQELDRYGMRFMAETGQEPPVILRRLLEDVGANNLFVNYDPSNLITHGNANPVDGLQLLGEFVREVHAKDGAYPVNGHQIGRQYPLGHGQVDYPALLRGLKSYGFDGNLCIEWERDIWNQEYVSPETRRKEIAESKVFLEKLVDEIEGAN